MNAIARMRPDVLSEVVSNLKRDYGFKEQGGYLRQGKCPSCGRKEVFTDAKAPWTVQCGRYNKCGWSSSTKDLYPDAFGKFNERFPATTQDPNATADAYMSFVRGFDPKRIKGWYRQGRFSHPKGDRATATVVFDIDRTAGIFMERLVETVRVPNADGEIEDRKANFEGAHKGLWWMPPGQKVTEGELWLVEGCLDAIALAMHGLQSAATLSAGNFPEKALASLNTKTVCLVWALDNDKAGNSFTRKHIKAAKALGFECRAAVIPQKGKRKTDWNDAHLARELEEEHLKRYRFHGDLLTAESPREKGVLVWEQTGGNSFAVEHAMQTYWFTLDMTAHGKMVEEMMTTGTSAHPRGTEFEAALKVGRTERIANCAFKFLYFLKSRETDESWYFAKIDFPHGRHQMKNTFTGAQVSTASEFKKRLMGIAPGAQYTGSTRQLDWIMGKYLDDIKVVDTVEFVGYSAEHKAWIFSDRAVSNGLVYELNDEDFFEIDKKSVKSLNHSLQLTIGGRSDYDPSWIKDVYLAFGAKGIIATAFMLGSLFAEHIRSVQKSFAFLEIVGEAGAGKSTLIEFLWKLVGRPDYEGFDPNKATIAARGRIMSQVSNLPVCFIESDRSGIDTAKAKQFDWDELKTAYNGRASRATGVKNGSNDTKEPPFRGSILISQNDAVNASEAILQRIVHLYFSCGGHTDAGKNAADRLSSRPVETVSNFVLQATAAEEKLMALFAQRAPDYEARIKAQPEVKHVRLAKNHGQMMALVDCLATLVELPDEWRKEAMTTLLECAKERQRAIASNHPMVEQFWEIVDFLGLDKLNHSNDAELISINLPHFQKLASQAGQSLPDMTDLKKHLKTSMAPAFKDNNHAVSSGIEAGKTIKCWRFKAPKGGIHA